MKLNTVVDEVGCDCRRDAHSKEGRYKSVAHRQLTLKQQLKGVTAALKSPRTPKQLKKGLEKRAKELRKQIKRKGSFWERLLLDE